MAWEVEFTDEFGAWWDTLDGEEQDAIDVVVGLLEEKGPQLCPSLSRARSRARNTGISGSCESSTGVNPTVFSMPSIHVESRFSWLGGRRPATIDGTRSTFRWQMLSTVSICKNCEERD